MVDFSVAYRGERGQKGFTLVELVLVIALIVIISGIAVGRMGTLTSLRTSSDLRKFINTWEFLFNEAVSRNENYRLILDLDNQSYCVRREVPREGNTVEQVDYLSGLRLDSEKKRREESAAATGDDAGEELKEEFLREDECQGGALDVLFYQHIFGDSEGSVQLGTPLAFPSLAESVSIAENMRFSDVSTPRGKHDSGKAYVRFSARGASEFAVVHLAVKGAMFTAVMNPSTGAVKLIEGDKDFEWTLGELPAN